MLPPVFIFGVPRSGTTLLRTILDSHSRIACGPETPWLGGHQPRSVMELWRALREEPWGYCASYGGKEEIVDAAAREFAARLMNEYAAQRGKARWAEKTPDNVLHLDFLLRLFPEARCIWLERDGLDVAVSTSVVEEHRSGISPFHEKKLSLGPGAPHLDNTPFNAILKWRHWSNLIAKGLRGREHMKTSYERLVTEPERTLREIMDFIGEPFEPGMLRYTEHPHDYPKWEWGSADVKARGTITRARVGRAERELDPADLEILRSLIPGPNGHGAARPAAALAGVAELNSPPFAAFMRCLNALAAPAGLQQFTNWSKVWEYPWLWFHGLRHVDWRSARLVDLGSALSPMPWLCAMLGARVTLIETDARHVPIWSKLRDSLRVEVDWHIVKSEAIPMPDAGADVYTSFSVIEHQPDKAAAVAEAARVLRPGGLMCVSFDICEPEMGMTFPAWNGRALTMREFEDLLWLHPAFGNRERPAWNTGDIPAYLAWHKQSAPHHNYATGAAVMRKLG